jgi:tetratricopeptide (TPR) repeat protein
VSVTSRFVGGALALAVALVSPTARANVWQEATGVDTGESATTRENYDHELAAGDAAAVLANTEGLSLGNIKRSLDSALDSYRHASIVRPELAEPYFRIGWLLYTFYFQTCERQNSRRSVVCDPDHVNHHVAQQIVDAWNAAEARAPNDPRFGSTPVSQVRLLFERAVIETKTADQNTSDDVKRLAAAARDYRKLLERGASDGDNETVLSNLAETYMMLGQLDEAIETYDEAFRHGTDIGTSYGFAVALDRDEQGNRAREIIASLGTDVYADFRSRLALGEIFFVPEGEQFYYLALAEEALGDSMQAIEYWTQFIQSGAHPQFQARARANRAALLAKRPSHPAPRIIPTELDF